MANEQSQIGVIGLGVMGRNLVLNIAEHKFPVAGYDKKSEQVEQLRKDSAGLPVRPCEKLRDFISALRKPRIVLMLVPAGAPVDSVLRDMLPHLSKGDILIDAGNSYFEDTNLRAKNFAGRGIHFLGVGVSGGEEGARRGPSIMPGGPEDAYRAVEPILTAIAAKVNGEPCVAYLGPGSAGHYIKMVHNGIEYGMMELIAETYDLMDRGLDFSDSELSKIYGGWSRGLVGSFLVEITAQIFRRIDEKTHKPLIDLICDQAKQKGTGMWTSQDAMRLMIPVPNIDTAVAMRDLSSYKSLRVEESHILSGPVIKPQEEIETILDDLYKALYVSMILTYSQGFALLSAASKNYEYSLDPATVAKIWRGGCIIRSAMLDQIKTAYESRPDLAHLLDDKYFAGEIVSNQQSLRNVVSMAANWGLPVPGMMAALSYFDGLRSAWLPANLIQAQRDYFGAHTYERVDEKGTFHTQWSDSEAKKHETI
jgi:6-phosphogluconate dehydrogenase